MRSWLFWIASGAVFCPRSYATIMLRLCCVCATFQGRNASLLLQGALQGLYILGMVCISSFLSISINLIDEWTISINFINMSERSPKDLYGKHKGKVNDDTPAKRTRVQDQDSGLLPDNTLPGGSPTPVLVPTPDPIESVQESGILNYRVKIIIFYVFWPLKYCALSPQQTVNSLSVTFQI